MLKRWSKEAYDIELFIDLDSMLKKNPKRKVKLYLKALVAKEMLKAGLCFTLMREFQGQL